MTYLIIIIGFLYAIYAENTSNNWEKMVSQKYCYKMCVLFGVSSIEELKQGISKCKFNHEIGYRGAWESAPAILNFIKVEDIGTIN